MEFKPRPYQLIMTDFIFKKRRCALWVPMGMGKTSASLFSINALRLINDDKTLVIAPLRVAESVWTDEVDKWDTFHSLKCTPIIGTQKERIERLNEPSDIHTVNYENLPWLIDTLKGEWPWKNVIADESTKLKSFRLGGKKGKRAKKLSKVAHKINRFVELTGTPSPNGLLDLWGQMWFLDKGLRLGRTYTSFTDRWFRTGYDGYSIEPMEHAFDEIMNRVKDITLSLNVKDWFDIDDPIINNIRVDLPEKVMNIYKSMEKDLIASVKNNEIEVFNAAAKTIKCLQIASGFIYKEDQSWLPIHEVKFDALDSIIEEAAGMPVLCAYHFKTDLVRLKKRYPRGVALGKDKSVIDKWNKGIIPLMFIHPASAGHGLNLQHGGNIVVMFGHWWNLEEYLQLIERIGPVRQKQSGYDRPVFIYNIIVKNTIDELVVQNRVTKKSVQDALLEYTKVK